MGKSTAGAKALGNLERGGPCGYQGQVAPPGAQTAGAQAHEDRADELAKGGGIDGLQLLLLAVQQVVAVQGAPWQTHALGRLIVVQEPLDLGPGGDGRIATESSLTHGFAFLQFQLPKVNQCKNIQFPQPSTLSAPDIQPLTIDNVTAQ